MMRGSAAQMAERSALSEFFIGKGAASACPFHRFNHRVAEEVKSAWGAGRQVFRMREPLPDQHKRDVCAKDDASAPPQPFAVDLKAGADFASGASAPSQLADVSGAVYLAAMRAKISDLNRQALFAELPACAPGLRTEPEPPPRPARHYKEPVIASVRAEPWFPDTALASPLPQDAIPSQGVISIEGSKPILPPVPALYAPREQSPPAPKPRLPTRSEPAGLINGYTRAEILSSSWLRRLYGHLIGMADTEASPMAEARIEELPIQKQPAATPKGPEPIGRLVNRITRPKQAIISPAKRAPESAIRPQRIRKEAQGGDTHKQKDSAKRRLRKPAPHPAHAPARENGTKDKAIAPAKAEKLLKMKALRHGPAEKLKIRLDILRKALALLKQRRLAAASLLRNGEKPVKARPFPESGKKKIKNIRTPSQAPSGAP